MKPFIHSILMGLLFVACAAPSNDSRDIRSLLPKSGDLSDWQPTDEPQQFKGDDLFLFINGGAEIYHEYGFEQVIAGEYKRGDHAINVELYEMEDPASAFGIYTFKIGDDGKQLSIGNDALLQNYYLNFWKGNYLATLVGFDSLHQTLDGLRAIARFIDARIEEDGEKPALLDLLPADGLNKQGVKYLEGNLALFNHSSFGSEDIFGIWEGVIGTYSGVNLFVFKYKNRKESLKYYQNAESKLRSSQSFEEFESMDHKFSMIDQSGRLVIVTHVQNYILIRIGRDEQKRANLLDMVRRNIEALSTENNGKQK